MTTLTITSAEQTNAGTYTVLVSNTNGFTLSAEAVLTVGLPGTTIGSYTINSGDMNSTSRNGGYVSSPLAVFGLVLVRHSPVRLQLHRLRSGHPVDVHFAHLRLYGTRLLDGQYDCPG